MGRFKQLAKEKSSRKNIERMEISEIHKELKKRNPKIHIGCAIEYLRIMNYIPTSKKHYFNLMLKAGEKTECQIKDRSMKFQNSDVDKRQKLEAGTALDALLAKVPDNFKNKIKYFKPETGEKKVRVKPKPVNDGVFENLKQDT